MFVDQVSRYSSVIVVNMLLTDNSKSLFALTCHKSHTGSGVPSMLYNPYGTHS